jgi:hypothetical protein
MERTSAFIGAVAVAEQVGTFTSPIRLPQWAKVALPIAGAVAATERAMTFRSQWLTRLGA